MPIIQDLSKYTTSDYVAKYVSEALSSSLSSGYQRYLPTQAFTMSGTWTPQVDGTYMIICVGKGGDGGPGESATGHRYNGYAGSGGGGGGVGIYIGEFKSGNSYPITISDTSTSFNTDWIVANAGGNGRGITHNESEDMTLQGGSGGIVTGTHLTATYNGESGETKTGYVYGGVEPGGRGGSAGCVLSIPGINHTAGIGCLPSDVSNGINGSAQDEYHNYISEKGYGGMFGAGGSGGGGAQATMDGSHSNATGGKGGAAIVLIQFLDTK